jgi:serine/alanine adding enzyme
MKQGIEINNDSIIRKGNEVDPDKWDTLIDNSAFSSPFQTRKFYDFCNTTPGYKGYVYAIEGRDGIYYAVCVISLTSEKGIKSWFSRRAIIYGGPVLADHFDSYALTNLLEEIKKDLSGKTIYIESRNFHDYSLLESIFIRNNWTYIPYLDVKVNLNYSTIDKLLSSFKYNRRREIKLTLKAGLTYGEAENMDQLISVYRILKEMYKTRIGLPLPKVRFFTDFWKSGLMKVFIVKEGDFILGGSFCVVLDNKGIYTYYYCGVRNYKPKTYPTHLAVLAAMEYGINNGLKYLDFMGAGQPGSEYGVRDYKMQFGGELLEYGRYIRINQKFLYYIGRKIIEITKKLKRSKSE